MILQYIALTGAKGVTSSRKTVVLRSRRPPKFEEHAALEPNPLNQGDWT